MGIYRADFTTILCTLDTMVFMIWKPGTIDVLVKFLNYAAFDKFLNFPALCKRSLINYLFIFAYYIYFI